jgi:predicted kinase
LKKPFRKYVETILRENSLVITCGLPGTWKTEISEELSKLKGYPLLRTDLIRRDLLKNEDIFDEKVASNMDKRRMIYEEMFRLTEELFLKVDSVILDATFITQSLRKQAAAMAAKYNKTFVILQTSCPQEIAIARILKRSRENYESNALTEQAYLNNKNKFEEVVLDDLELLNTKPDIIHLIVDTSKDTPEDWYIIGTERKQDIKVLTRHSSKIE